MQDEVSAAEVVQSLPPTVNAWLFDALEGWRHLEKLGKRARKTRPADAIRVILGSPAETLLASSPEIAADFERAFDPPDRLDELQRQPSMLEAVQSPTKLAAWLERVWSALPDDASFHSTPGIDLLIHLLEDIPDDLLAPDPIVFDLGCFGEPGLGEAEEVDRFITPGLADALDVGVVVDQDPSGPASVLSGESLSPGEARLLRGLALSPRVRAELLRGAVLAGGAVRDVLADGARATPVDLDFVVDRDAWSAFQVDHPEIARTKGLLPGAGFRVAKEADADASTVPLSWIVPDTMTLPAFLGAFEAEPNRLALYVVSTGTSRTATATATAAASPRLRLAVWPGALETARVRAYRPNLRGVLRGGGGPLRALVRALKMAARGWVVDPAWATVLAYLLSAQHDLGDEAVTPRSSAGSVPDDENRDEDAEDAEDAGVSPRLGDDD